MSKRKRKSPEIDSDRCPSIWSMSPYIQCVRCVGHPGDHQHITSKPGEAYAWSNSKNDPEPKGHWVELPPQVEGQCSWPTCTLPAIWTRKLGWMVAPGSPDGDVCEYHHCWERIPVQQCQARLSLRGSDRVECAKDRGHKDGHRNFVRDIVWYEDYRTQAPDIPTKRGFKP